MLTALFMPLPAFFFVWNTSIHSEVFLSLSLSLLLTALIRLLNLVPFHIEDYLFLFSAFFFPQRLFNSASVLLGHLWLFWLIFCVYYTAVKLSLHSLRGNQFSCYLSFVILSVSAYGFFLVNYFAVPYLQKAVGSYALGLIGTTGLYSLLLLGAILFFRPRFFKPIEQLIQLGKKYPAIEPYYFLFSALILVFCTVIFLPFSILSFQDPLVFLLFPALCILFLRLALARALVRDPQCLLLDESTCHLDAARARDVQKNILMKMENRTCVIVTHDMNLARTAGHIIVLDRGTVCGEGTHDTLYESCSVYRNLYDKAIS